MHRLHVVAYARGNLARETYSAPSRAAVSYETRSNGVCVLVSAGRIKILHSDTGHLLLSFPVLLSPLTESVSLFLRVITNYSMTVLSLL